MRIFTVSDLHVDYAENYAWVKAISSQDYQDDFLIVPGDISHHIKRIENTLMLLKKKFKEVFFVVGNHDLWVGMNSIEDSMERFFRIKKIAANNGVWMEAKTYPGFSIVPLFSWFDFSFGEPSEKLIEAWQDFYLCKWPDNMKEKEITDYFLKMNERSFRHYETKTIISFSHFLPSIDLMNSYISRNHTFLYPVLGTAKLLDQIKKIKSTIHIYGHSHVNTYKRKDNILFINNAFGYPRERGIASKELKCIYEGD